MTSVDVRDYIKTLSQPEQRRVSTELYRAMLYRDTQKNWAPQPQAANK